MGNDLLSKRFSKSEKILSKKIEDEVVLLPIKDKMEEVNKVYVLRGVAVDIWKLINGKRTGQQILKKILKEYQVEPEQASSDLQETLSSLVERNCIIEKT